MKPLLVTNIERVETANFLVAVAFNAEGYIEDEIITPFESYEKAIDKLLELADGETIDIWTTDHRLFTECLKVGGLAAHIKHPSDVKETKERIERHYDILFDLYELKPARQAPKWRAFFVGHLTKLLNFIKGDYDYDEI